MNTSIINITEIERPLLTIAVPTYNGSSTLKQSLDKILMQFDAKLEVLISDNCSNDETPRIIAEYKKKYPFLKVVRNETNGGADYNFLQCMRLASGKFTMMVSDDDIVLDNAVNRIIGFLERNPNITLAYLDTVRFKDHYIDLNHCLPFRKFSPQLKADIVTTNKKEFMHYAQRLWGYTSNYIWSTDRFQQIVQPEQYFGTYFLQSYINILCSNKSDDLLGLIKGPCVAIGEYGIIGNYDTALVEGIFYKRMIDFAVRIGGYNRRQLNKYYIWKICLLGRNAIIKEMVAGNKKTKIKNLFKCTWNYPRAWVTLYPFLIIPKFICIKAFKYHRKLQGRPLDTYVNRPT